MGKKEGFIAGNYILFINSFKRISLKFFLILAYDILFYFILMQAGKFFIAIIKKRSASIDLSQGLLGLDQQAAAGLLGSVRGFFFFLIFSAILFLILVVVNWSIFKGLIWTATANKKFSFAFFKKFLLLNLVWLPLWVLLMFLFAMVISPETAPIFIIMTAITAFYFTNALYPLFLKENKLSKIKEAFKLGIKKIHHFIVPYAVIGILFYIISKAYSLIAANIGLNPNVFLGILLVFIAWSRYYFVEIIHSLGK